MSERKPIDLSGELAVVVMPGSSRDLMRIMPLSAALRMGARNSGEQVLVTDIPEDATFPDHPPAQALVARYAMDPLSKVS